MSKGFYFLKTLERSRKVSPNIPVNMGSLARHETLVLGVRLRPPKNFLNFRQYFRAPSSTCQKFRQVHTSSSTLQKLSTGFHKTSSTMWTTSCIFETLTKCVQRDTHERAALHITVPCARLRKIGLTFVNVCEAFPNGGPKKSMTRTGKGSRNEKEPTA